MYALLNILFLYLIYCVSKEPDSELCKVVLIGLLIMLVITAYLVFKCLALLLVLLVIIVAKEKAAAEFG